MVLRLWYLIFVVCMDEEIKSLVKDNDIRLAKMRTPFNPITGEGSIGERKTVEIEEFGTLHLPRSNA